jgi:CRP/FNR family transcriptional regulator, cyclic AMP receptor protein
VIDNSAGYVFFGFVNRALARQVMEGKGWLSRQPKDFRDDLLRKCHLRHFHAGEVLYHAGDEAAGVFGLLVGVIELKLPSGNVGTIRTPGYWVGEAAAFRNAPRLATISAKSSVHVFYLPLAEFRRLIANADYCRYFALLTIEHLEEALSVVASLWTGNATTRVSQRLLALSQASSDNSGILHVTQSDMASMCGLSRQTVNSVLKTLTADGVIRSEYGRLWIMNEARLTQLAQVEPG